MRWWLPIVLLAAAVTPGFAGPAPWFSRVLVTNDDGIDDPRLGALARAFAEVAEVVVVAPAENCSGSTSYCSVFRTDTLSASPCDLGPDIAAWSVDGFPGDCIVLALWGLLSDDPPDLVVSGVNSGPNLADAWIASGTIGAARVAAHAGIPAIAFSGLDKHDSDMMEAVPRWCVSLAASPAVRDLGDDHYLSVNFPRVAKDEIAGVRWAGVGRRFYHGNFDPQPRQTDGSRKWAYSWYIDDDPQPADSDVSLYRSGYITVTPLRASEHDAAPGRTVAILPGWRP